MSAVPATVYSTEMATDSLRGMFITWNSISMSLGILFVYIFGYIFQDNWRAVAGTSAMYVVIFSISPPSSFSAIIILLGFDYIFKMTSNSHYIFFLQISGTSFSPSLCISSRKSFVVTVQRKIGRIRG